MSRIGRQPVHIPEGVKCELSGRHLKVTGPKGVLERDFSPEMTIIIADKQLTVRRPSDKPEHRALHGLTRALISNMVTGVTQGFQKVLVVQGIGYRASLRGKSLNLVVGLSHPVTVEPPEGITFTVEGMQTVKISGIDKELVGQTAAKVRALRKPDPYKAKGIRYEDERIRRKVGKAGVK